MRGPHGPHGSRKPGEDLGSRLISGEPEGVRYTRGPRFDSVLIHEVQGENPGGFPGQLRKQCMLREVRVLSSPPMVDALDRNAVIRDLALAIAAVAAGDIGEARMQVAAIAESLGQERQQTLPGLPSPPPADAATRHREAIARLFAYWRTTCGHPTGKLTTERIVAVGARLKEGYTEAEIRRAIDGAAAAAYVAEDSGKRFDDLTLICRNGSKLEDFIERGVRAKGEITPDVSAASPVDDQIADLRVRMSAMKKDGRTTEYAAAAQELQKLMAKRKGS